MKFARESIDTALASAGSIVSGWEKNVRCVVCGFSVPWVLEVREEPEDADDQRLVIECTANLTGWCYTMGGVRPGMYCPKCR